MNEKHIQALIDASIRYADKAEAQKAFHERKTAELQRAAKLAMAGNQVEAKRIVQHEQLSCTVVFDFADVHNAMIRAVKPFRKRVKK